MNTTPLQRAIMLAIAAFKASVRLLSTREQRTPPQDVMRAALARGYLRDFGLIDQHEREERAA